MPHPVRSTWLLWCVGVSAWSCTREAPAIRTIPDDDLPPSPTETDTVTPEDTGTPLDSGTPPLDTGTLSGGPYLRTTAASLALPLQGFTEVLSVEVPAGDWYLRGKAVTENTRIPDYVRCVLVGEGVQFDASATYLDDDTPGVYAPGAATLVVQGLATFATPTVVKLLCGHDFQNPGVSIDAGASLVAVPTTGLSGINAVYVNLPTNGDVPVLVASVTASGVSVLLGEATVVTFAGADYVRCSIDDGSALDTSSAVIGGTSPGPAGEVGPIVATVSMQAVVDAASGTSYAVNCAHDEQGGGQYVDPLASLIALPAVGAVEDVSEADLELTDCVVSDCPVASVVVGAGTWAVVAKATAVNLGVNDDVTCTLTQDGVVVDESRTEVGTLFGGDPTNPGPPAATVSVQTLVETSGDETLTLSCRGELPSDQSIDLGAAIVAFPVQSPIL